MPQVAGIRRFGAAALDLAWVAAGRLGNDRRRTADPGRAPVRPRAHDDPRPLEQLRAIPAELLEKDPNLLGGCPALVFPEVGKNEKHPGTFHMTKEFVPEAASF